MWLAAWVLLGCDAEAHIRLLEPADDTTEPDAGQPPPQQEDAATPVPADEPDIALPDPGMPPSAVPGDPDLPDAAAPPLADEDAGFEPSSSPDDALVLRYDFSGSGDVVPDLVGDRDARLLGGTLLDPSRTFIDLDGVDDYVDLPNGVVSELHSATFIVWLSWVGGACWQRIFDFGLSEQGEDEVGSVATSLFLTPRACRGDGDRFTAMAEFGSTQHVVAGDAALPTRYALQVALVVDDDAQTFTLYNTEKVGEAPAPFRLDQLTDDNNWLGRSQWAQDAFFTGAIGEFVAHQHPHRQERGVARALAERRVRRDDRSTPPDSASIPTATSPCAHVAATSARAFVTHVVQPGTLFMPMHDVGTNLLTYSSFDPYSRQPSYKACAVRVELG